MSKNKYINESKTEEIFRNLIREKGFYDNDKVIVEEQSSDNDKIRKCLSNASKKNSNNNIGRPDFIITHKDYMDLVIVVECKADILKHKSNNLNAYTEYAVDGVLLYGSFLSKMYNVICIAFSGQSNDFNKMDTFYYPKGGEYEKIMETKFDDSENNILPFEKYIEKIKKDPNKIKINRKELDELHQYLIKNIDSNEDLNGIDNLYLITGIMISLKDPSFKKLYQTYEETDNLQIKFQRAISDYLTESNAREIYDGSEIVWKEIRTTIENKKLSIKDNIGRTYLYHIIYEIYNYIDSVGDDGLDYFYSKFVSYLGVDSKKIGVVMTPKHIADLMCEIIEINKKSIVLDACAGTGTFLNSVIKKFSDQASCQSELSSIKKEQIIGIENNYRMYTILYTSMMLQNCNMENIYYANFFNIKEKITKMRPTHVLINPPYSSNKNNEELKFIKELLDCLPIGGKLACIVPERVSLPDKKNHLELKERLLNRHRLDAVMTMPTDLFSPNTKVTTCIMVFTAHKKHDEDDYHRTYLSNYTNDGFKITQNKRQPKNNEIWNNIKEDWVFSFLNKKEFKNKSLLKQITYLDEWRFWSHAESDFRFKQADFEKSLREYVSYRTIYSKLKNDKDIPAFNENIKFYDLDDIKWGRFSYIELFNMRKGNRIIKEKDCNDLEFCYETLVNYVTAKGVNNGVLEIVNLRNQNKIEKPNLITIASNGSVGSVFFQNFYFVVSGDILVFEPKKEGGIDEYIGIFLKTVMDREKYKYSYGVKPGLDRVKKTTIQLPVDEEGLVNWDFMREYVKSLPMAIFLDLLDSGIDINYSE